MTERIAKELEDYIEDAKKISIKVILICLAIAFALYILFIPLLLLMRVYFFLKHGYWLSTLCGSLAMTGWPTPPCYIQTSWLGVNKIYGALIASWEPTIVLVLILLLAILTIRLLRWLFTA